MFQNIAHRRNLKKLKKKKGSRQMMNSCLFMYFFSFFLQYKLAFTYHMGNYHPRQRNKMQRSKGPKLKSQINTLQHTKLLWRMYYFYLPIIRTLFVLLSLLFPCHLWDPRKIPVLGSTEIAGEFCLHSQLHTSTVSSLSVQLMETVQTKDRMENWKNEINVIKLNLYTELWHTESLVVNEQEQ